jgi:NAD-specific glutamate dehydrogenase
MHSAEGTYYFNNCVAAMDIGLPTTNITVHRDYDGGYSSMEISTIVGLFTLSSGEFSINHPKFIKTRIEFLTERLEAAEERYRSKLKC